MLHCRTLMLCVWLVALKTIWRLGIKNLQAMPPMRLRTYNYTT